MPPVYRVLVDTRCAGLFSLLGWRVAAGRTRLPARRRTVAVRQRLVAARRRTSTPLSPPSSASELSGIILVPRAFDYVDQQLSGGAVGLTHAYLSLGDREARTPNPQIMHVRENAELLASRLEMRRNNLTV